MLFHDNFNPGRPVAIPWMLDPHDNDLELEIHGCGCGCAGGCGCACSCSCDSCACSCAPQPNDLGGCTDDLSGQLGSG